MAKKKKEEENDYTLEDSGTYLFMEGVDDKSGKKLIEWILEENLKKRHERLRLIINSPGGSVDACFAMIDVIKGSKIPIDTVGIGCIASCGFMTFIAGKHRVLTPNTSILSHQYSWGSRGKHHELMAQVTEFELINRRMLRHYKKCLKMNEKTIKKYLLPPKDVWLTSEEALKLKICHEIKELY